MAPRDRQSFATNGGQALKKRRQNVFEREQQKYVALSQPSGQLADWMRDPSLLPMRPPGRRINGSTTTLVDEDSQARPRSKGTRS